MNMNQIESARQLLPWYVTGKLSSAEVSFVKEAITACPSLYKEYETQLQLSQMIKQDPQVINTSIISTQEQRLDRLMQRIHADQQQPTVMDSGVDQPFFMQTLASIKQRLVNLFAVSVNKWVFTAVASVAVLAVVMQTTLFGFLQGKSQVGNEVIHYVSMSADSSIILSGERIIIQFDQQATQEEINLFLQTIDSTLIEHPEGSSFYQLTLKKQMTVEQIDALLVKIKADKLIQFAGRSS